MGLVTATVFVEETYEIGDGKIIITNSRLLPKDEVEAIGIENFESLEMQMESPITTQATAVNKRGTLTITFSCYDNSSGNSTRYELYGKANWSGLNWWYNAVENPAVGEDFFGFAWGGGFTSTILYATGTWIHGPSATIYLADAVPNAAVVWEFDEFLHEVGKVMLWVEEVNIRATLSKNRKTGGGNTTQAILKYIHTYQEPTGGIEISAAPGNVGAGFVLQNTLKQWSIICIMNGLYY